MNILTMGQILKETIDFYGQDPVNRRASIERGEGRLDKCLYYLKLENGECKTCAVGRCLIDAEKFGKKYFGSVLYIFSDDTINNDQELGNLDDYLLPQYIGHSTIFWNDVQHIHDNKPYWNVFGLSEEGKQQVKTIITKYEITDYSI